MNGTGISPAALVLVAGAGYALWRLLAPTAVVGAGSGPAAADLVGLTEQLEGLRADQAEQLDRLRAAQAEQAERLRALGDLVVLVLPGHEKTHLRNLRNGAAAEYTGNRDVRESLRHLQQLGLLTTDRPIDGINDGEVVNLHDFIRLTSEGERWAGRLAALDNA
jgi:hypothetical protein